MGNDVQWAVVITRHVTGVGPEYLAEDRHDNRGEPYWTGRRDDAFILRFGELQAAADVAAAYPGARLECVLVE